MNGKRPGKEGKHSLKESERCLASKDVPRLPATHRQAPCDCDIRNPAGGDTFEQSLNKIIAKNTFIPRLGAQPSPPERAWRPQDGTRSFRREDSCKNKAESLTIHTGFDVPPHLSRFYDVRKSEATEFTEKGSAGETLRDLYDELEAKLRFPGTESGQGELPLAAFCHDKVHHFLIPAFFETVTELQKMGRAFTVVIRTFGTDVRWKTGIGFRIILLAREGVVSSDRGQGGSGRNS